MKLSYIWLKFNSYFQLRLKIKIFSTDWLSKYTNHWFRPTVNLKSKTGQDKDLFEILVSFEL